MGVQGQEIYEGDQRTLNVTATTTIKATPGKIARILVVASAALNLTVYDDPANTAGKEVWSKAVAAGDIYVFQCPMMAAIRVAFVSGTGQITVIWS